VDGDFVADFIYVGDQRGNLWRFNVSSSNTSDWTSTSNFGVLFTATDASNVAQPITSRPSVGFHPDGFIGTLVYFGTGKYLEAVDTQITGAQTQTFYGIWDRMKPTVASNLVAKSDLLTQTLSLNGAAREVTDNTMVWKAGTPVPSPSYLGWKVNLPDPGERQITDSVLREGRVIFTTTIPSNDPCDPAGSGWLMELDSRNGGRLDDTFDTDGDGDVDIDDKITSGGEDFGAAGLLQTDGAPSQPVIIYDPTGGSNTPGTPPTEYKLTSNFDGSVTSTEEKPNQPRGAWRQLK
jgi:type IV pilus assembly protein PilY1